MTSKKIIAIVCGLFLLTGGIAMNSYTHCQVPCGIYGDEMVFEKIHQDITTIEKAMNQIEELSAADDKNYNQIVRWVNNKEEHADKIMTVAENYFLAQRVKPAEESDAEAYKEYTEKLVLLHHIIVHSMKCKQTTDLSNVAHLKKSVEDFYVAYFGEDHEKHTH